MEGLRSKNKRYTLEKFQKNLREEEQKLANYKAGAIEIFTFLGVYIVKKIFGKLLGIEMIGSRFLNF